MKISQLITALEDFDPNGEVYCRCRSGDKGLFSRDLSVAGSARGGVGSNPVVLHFVDAEVSDVVYEETIIA